VGLVSALFCGEATLLLLLVTAMNPFFMLKKMNFLMLFMLHNIGVLPDEVIIDVMSGLDGKGMYNFLVACPPKVRGAVMNMLSRSKRRDHRVMYIEIYKARFRLRTDLAALENAVWKGHRKVFKLIYPWETIDHIFVDCVQSKSPTGLKNLLDWGLDIHAADDYALRIASQRGYLEIVRLALKYGADVHAKDDYSLLAATERGHTEIVKLLLDAGADVHSREGKALISAGAAGYHRIVKLLLHAGANVHSSSAESALSWASANGHDETVKLLLSAGVDVDAKRVSRNRIGNPLLWAIRDRRASTVRILTDAGATHSNHDP
jgi:Ankyrin repeats (3 copies)